MDMEEINGRHWLYHNGFNFNVNSKFLFLFNETKYNFSYQNIRRHVKNVTASIVSLFKDVHVKNDAF